MSDFSKFLLLMALDDDHEEAEREQKENESTDWLYDEDNETKEEDSY